MYTTNMKVKNLKEVIFQDNRSLLCVVLTIYKYASVATDYICLCGLVVRDLDFRFGSQVRFSVESTFLFILLFFHSWVVFIKLFR